MTRDVSVLLPTVLIPALLNSVMSQLFNFFLSTPKALLYASNDVTNSAVVATAATFLPCIAQALYHAIAFSNNLAGPQKTGK